MFLVHESKGVADEEEESSVRGDYVDDAELPLALPIFTEEDSLEALDEDEIQDKEFANGDPAIPSTQEQLEETTSTDSYLETPVVPNNRVAPNLYEPEVLLSEGGLDDSQANLPAQPRIDSDLLKLFQLDEDDR